MLKKIALLTSAAVLSFHLVGFAADFKVNDRVLAPYGGDLIAATIVGGPNSRGQFRVHFDKTDSQRDKWLAPSELQPYVELGELKAGDVLQVEIMSAWQWVEVVRQEGDKVLVHWPNWTDEYDEWFDTKQLRRPPGGDPIKTPWNYPYLNGQFVTVLRGGNETLIGRFEVKGDNMYVNDYRVTDLSQIQGVWKPKYKVGDIVRVYHKWNQWEQVKIDSLEPGSYKVTGVKQGNRDQINEDALYDDWDYDGFYALAAPLYQDSFQLKMGWLSSIENGTMNGITLTDAQVKAGLDLLSKTEAQLKAKYPKVPGKIDCNECPARVMHILSHRKQIVMKAAGLDVNGFVNNQIQSYQRELDDAKKAYFWSRPLSFGATNVEAEVAKELSQREADLKKDIARNKLIDPAFVFKYDRAPIVAAVKQAQAEFVKLLVPFNQVSTDMGQYSGHTADAEALAISYVKKLRPQGKILGANTLAGGWQKDTSVSINTSQTVATISKYLSTRVVVKVSDPAFKFPLVYALSLYRTGGPAYVEGNSVIAAFYKP